jgi:L-asparaginase
MPSLVVVIGTGGTIAGTATGAADAPGYRAGTLAPEDLIRAVPGLAGADGERIETLALAQIDSKDMAHALWQSLARCAAEQLARPEVDGVVITHGTDTLEETAYFLHRTVACGHKPLVLTAAMRPATAPSPDGPQNLLDAVRVARAEGRGGGPPPRGVLVVFAGRIWAGAEVRKLHGWQLDAFGGGDAGPLALIEGLLIRPLKPWPDAALHAADVQARAAADWPAVDIVISHAGVRGDVVLPALVAAGARGIVIAGTGNGSVHRSLLEAAAVARAQGVRVVRASRCALGGVVDDPLAPPGTLPSAGPLTPVQARIELLLDLLHGAR